MQRTVDGFALLVFFLVLCFPFCFYHQATHIWYILREAERLMHKFTELTLPRDPSYTTDLYCTYRCQKGERDNKYYLLCREAKRGVALGEEPSEAQQAN